MMERYVFWEPERDHPGMAAFDFDLSLGRRALFVG